MSAHSHQLVERHLRDFFKGHECVSQAWALGPMAQLFPAFRVLEFAPGPRTGLWCYVSTGAFQVRPSHPLEFLLLTPSRTPQGIELVTMVAYYHKDIELGVGHTLGIGQPWLPTATCEHFLVSKPYPFGPALELCSTPGGHLHICWLLPITSAERQYKVQRGVEALEQLFDDQALEYWILDRASLA